MVSPYEIQPYNTNKQTKQVSNTNNKFNRHHNFKRLLLTPIHVKLTSKETSLEVKPVESKNKIKGGGNIESNDEYSDEILHKNNT